MPAFFILPFIYRYAIICICYRCAFYENKDNNIIGYNVIILAADSLVLVKCCLSIANLFNFISKNS